MAQQTYGEWMRSNPPIPNMTAVEWLANEISYQLGTNDLLEGLYKQAKQMEKEQIKESWNDGNLLGRNGNILLEYNTGEQYYNETYKNK